MESDTSDAEPDAEEPLTEEESRDLLNVDGLEGLGPLAEKLQDKPLMPIAAAAIAEAIDELAGGNTATYVNTQNGGINRVGVITDDFTVRVLMLTGDWKWRGPYTPEDPEGYLASRGYRPAPEVADGS